MKVGILDKVFQGHIGNDEVMGCSDEAEAIAIAAGHYLATGEKAEVYVSADGFMNCLNFITSWIIPEKIPMHIVISIGRTEKPHYIATEITEPIIKLLETYGTETISYQFVRQVS